ncbi:hypothetical protein OsccyDRAFT_3872 [Leptolyngbyaceae cyanobacterium JSC-12]|nr:hypothetical protein OsccyDRAFT_3872 [Leptolyngbyaceae cyanobacterium JSC-12]
MSQCNHQGLGGEGTATEVLAFFLDVQVLLVASANVPTLTGKLPIRLTTAIAAIVVTFLSGDANNLKFTGLTPIHEEITLRGVQ